MSGWLSKTRNLNQYHVMGSNEPRNMHQSCELGDFFFSLLPIIAPDNCFPMLPVTYTKPSAFRADCTCGSVSVCRLACVFVGSPPGFGWLTMI